MLNHFQFVLEQYHYKKNYFIFIFIFYEYNIFIFHFIILKYFCLIFIFDQEVHLQNYFDYVFNLIINDSLVLILYSIIINK